MASGYTRYPASSSGGIATYANFAAFPGSAANGTLAIALDTGVIYEYRTGSASWVAVGGPGIALSIGTFDSGTPSANGAHIDTNALIMQSASATLPGLVNTGTQVLAGAKTFSGLISADGGIDRSTVGTLTIGATNTTTLNIGNAGCTVNIQGTTIYENTPILVVADPLITVNHGGGAGSGQNSGIEIEENSIVTGYAETSSDRNSWIFKAPNTAGIVTVTPGASGFTIDQGSHNPLTLGAVGSSPNANAASLSTQVLTLQPADGSFPGVVTTSAQSFAGAKTFSGVGSFPSGAVGAVGLHLSTDVGTGFYRPGVDQLNIAAAGGVVANFGTSGAAFTGVVSATSTVTGTQLISTVVTGTAPLTVASTTVVANLNAATAVLAATSTIADDTTTNATMYPLWASAATGALPLKVSSTKLTFNPSTAALTATTFIGAVTGHASLDLALTGGTVTGALVNSFAGAASSPGLLISGAPFTGGSATTTKPQLSGTSNAWSTSGTLIGGNGPTAFAGNLMDLQVDGVTKAAFDSTGLLVQTNGSEVVKSGFTASNRWTINNTTHTFPILQYGTNTGYVNIGNGLFANDWFVSITAPSTNTSPIGNLIHNTSLAPIFNIRNSSNTAGNWGSIVFSGNSDNATCGIIGYNDTQTSSSETGHLGFFTTTGGTRAEQMTIAGSGVVTATTFVGALTGNATTATTATNATNGATVSVSNSASYFPLFAASSSNGNQPFNLGTGLTFNPSTNVLTTTTFVGALTGTASGNATLTANNHGMLVSGSGNTITVVAPDASTTKVWTSGGSSADPSWQAPASAPTAEVYYDGGGALGGSSSGETRVLCFTNARISNGGSDITYGARTTTTGDKFTINTAGTYTICTGIKNGAGPIASGITINSSATSTNVITLPFAQGYRTSATVTTSSYPASCSWTGHLAVNDVVRIQTDGDPGAANAQTFVSICRLN